MYVCVFAWMFIQKTSFMVSVAAGCCLNIAFKPSAFGWKDEQKNMTEKE